MTGLLDDQQPAPPAAGHSHDQAAESVTHATFRPTRSSSQTSLTYKRVYVIDDDPLFLRTLVDILAHQGYEPLGLETGAAALDALCVQTPQVALIDLNLDDMPGLDLLAAIKQAAPQTECIMLTGQAATHTVIEAINRGAYGYLQKPYAIEQLLLLVRRACEKHDAHLAQRQSEARYRSLFEDSPISLWEADFSRIKAYLAQQQAGSGVDDLAVLLAQRPELLETCADLMTVLDVNQTTLDVFAATDKQDVLETVGRRVLARSSRMF
ncbi:MAG: response regulator, partial [Anaerolineae bacterium]|nr:response regulator [Anaerolineae bacterium]